MMVLRLFFVVLISFRFKLTLAENPSVIIVGAGAAGIAAAAKLLENGITNVTILGAENRIGGRIHSVKFGEEYVDVGAQFCHGQKGNVVYETVKDLNLLEHIKDDPESIKLYTSKGTRPSADVVHDLYYAILNYDEGFDSRDANTSLGDAFLTRYNATILKKYSNDSEKLEIAVDGIKFIEDNVLLNEGSSSWLKISAVDHFVECEGDQALVWKTRGYQIFLDVLIKSYPNSSQKLPIDDKIILNKKVDKIIWSGPKATVHASDNFSLSADHVIFTPSIGVLKKNKDALFEPQLPLSKTEALQAIGFEGIIKIILHFPTVWWRDETAFTLVWRREDLLDVRKEFSDGPHKNGVSWVTSISVFEVMPSNPRVLIAWLSGDLLLEIEQTSEEVVKKGCIYVIKKFFGKDYNVTEPDQIIWSKWNTNPNFLGTYSYEKVGFYREEPHQMVLAEPLTNKEGKKVLLFAGEATHSNYFANVHGAVESGRREADRIINLYKQL